MDLFHKIQGIIDANTCNIPEGDYLELCNAIKELREHVKPPSFLDQTIPMLVATGGDTFLGGPPVYQQTIPDGQPQEWMDQELSEYFHQLYSEWSDTTVAEVSVVGEK